MSGIATPNLPALPVVDDLIGNADGATVRISLARLIALVIGGHGPTYETRSGLVADLDWAEGTIATVWGGDEATRGVYRKRGAVGSGSWARMGELPGMSTTLAALAAKADAADLADGRVYAQFTANPSGKNIAASADSVVCITGSGITIWQRVAAPSDGVETDILKRDNGGIWWRLRHDPAVDSARLDLAENRGTRAMGSRAEATARVAEFPASVTRIWHSEAGKIVFRGRGVMEPDAINGDGWGVIAELDIDQFNGLVNDEKNAREQAVSSLSEGLSEANETLTSLNQKIDNEASTRRQTTNLDGGDPIWVLRDADEQIVAQFDASGGLRIIGLDSDLAAAVNRLKDKQNTGPDRDGADPILDLRDAENAIVMRVNSDGGLMVPGLGKSVQDEISGIKLAASRREGSTLLYPDPSDINLPAMTGLSRRSADMVCAQAAFRREAAPLPCWQIPQAYTPPDEWFSSISWTASAGDGYVDMASPYRPHDQFVHPRLLYFTHGWHGYRWVMAITPYADFDEENPCLYGSNDLRKFDLLSDWAPMPLATPPKSYLSDVSLTYDPTTGEIICLWRGQETHSTEWGYYMRRTVDGYNWTPTEILFEASRHGGGSAVSPSLIYNTDTSEWWLFVSGLTGMTAYVSTDLNYKHWTSRPLTGSPHGWHTDVSIIGNRLLALSGWHWNDTRGLRVAYSDPGDWTRWTERTTDCLDVSAIAQKYGASTVVPYKVSAVPIIRRNTIDTWLAWSTESVVDGLRWRLFVTRHQFNIQGNE